jgi:hypothetical protein
VGELHSQDRVDELFVDRTVIPFKGPSMTSASRQSVRKGPWFHQLLVWIFTGVFALLSYWLLGFIVDDIGDWPPPQYDDVEKRLLDTTLVEQSLALRNKADQIERRSREQKERQEILRDSTTNSQGTMNQLLEIQKLALQKNVTPSVEEQKALADSEELFLSNQKQYQQLNEELATLAGELRTVQEETRTLEKTLELKRQPIFQEFGALVRKHDLKVAATRLAALTPMLILAFFLFVKHRSGTYGPLVYGFGAAVLLKAVMVIHEHFPSQYFKYILILTCLIAVVRILVYLLRMIAFPNHDWLLKRYREAYEAFFCPICDYPIRSGPLKYLYWSRRSLRKLQIPAPSTSDVEQAYTCPNCATKLFEECPVCHSIRHSLLPACEKCGSEKAT